MNEKDPIAMYIVVREFLSMSVGKTAAQVAHVTGRIYEVSFSYMKYIDSINEPDQYCYGPINIDQDKIMKIDIFKRWQDASHRKIVLSADEKEWIKLKELPDHIVIVDAGFTELTPGTETIIGFWPMLKSQRPKILKKLQAL